MTDDERRALAEEILADAEPLFRARTDPVAWEAAFRAGWITRDRGRVKLDPKSAGG